LPEFAEILARSKPEVLLDPGSEASRRWHELIHVNDAPIVEAVLDIRVELPKDVTLDTLEMFYDKIKVRYPEKQHRTELSAGIRLDPQGASFEKPEASQTGYLFRSQVEKKVVQSRLNGFSFNKP